MKKICILIMIGFLTGCMSFKNVFVINNFIDNELIEKLTNENSLINKIYIVFSGKTGKNKIIKMMDISLTVIKITMLNLDNYNTTRVADSPGPFKPYIIIINDQLDFTVIEEENFIYKYDPTHPDAIGQGENKGYVAYPNINYDAELLKLQQYITFYKTLSFALKRFDENYITNLDVMDIYLLKYSK